MEHGEFLVRKVNEEEIESEVECYECSNPAEFVEELLHPLEGKTGFITRLYYCKVHADRIQQP